MILTATTNLKPRMHTDPASEGRIRRGYARERKTEGNDDNEVTKEQRVGSGSIGFVFFGPSLFIKAPVLNAVLFRPLFIREKWNQNAIVLTVRNSGPSLLLASPVDIIRIIAGWTILVSLALISISAVFRLVCAIFSPAVRHSIREHPGTHILWFGTALISVVFFLILCAVANNARGHAEWMRKISALKAIPRDRLELAVQGYIHDNKNKGGSLPATVSLQNLVSNGYLREQDIKGLESSDAAVFLEVDETQPNAVRMRVRSRWGTDIGLMIDGTVSGLPKNHD
jgi:hypothetical protein